MLHHTVTLNIIDMPLVCFFLSLLFFCMLDDIILHSVISHPALEKYMRPPYRVSEIWRISKIQFPNFSSFFLNNELDVPNAS